MSFCASSFLAADTRHGVQPSGPGFDGRPPVQGLDDGVFTVLHGAVELCDPLPGPFQPGCRPVPFFLLPEKLRLDFGLLGQKPLFFFLPAADFLLQRPFPPFQVLAVCGEGTDLFPQDADFPFQLSAQDGGIRQKRPGSVHLLFQALDLALALLVFFPDPFVFFRRFLQIAGRDGKLFLRLLQLLAKPFIFQQEHVHIQVL